MAFQYASCWVLSLILVCGVAGQVAAQTPYPQNAGRQPTGQRGNGQQRIGQQRTGQQATGQQRTARQTAGPAQVRPASAQTVAPRQAKQAPPWIPLTADHQAYLDKILNYWEHETAKVERYRCNFKRYEYEMVRRKTANDQAAYDFVNKTYTEGKIQYAAPDKGLFKAEVIKHRTPPKVPGGQPVWEDQVGGPREHWICDGESIFEFNHLQKQLVVRSLPPEMKGKQIAEGPLPFMFGAKAEQIKRRFWVHVITPKSAKNEYHLEAVPRTLQDSKNFRMLHIIIDGGDFLPKAMVMFHLTNNAKTTYLFEEREVNWKIPTLEAANIFRRKFFEPALPGRDWKKVSASLQPSAPPPQAAPQTRAGLVRPPFGSVRQAQAPGNRRSPR